MKAILIANVVVQKCPDIGINTALLAHSFIWAVVVVVIVAAWWCNRG